MVQKKTPPSNGLTDRTIGGPIFDFAQNSTINKAPIICTMVQNPPLSLPGMLVRGFWNQETQKTNKGYND